MLKASFSTLSTAFADAPGTEAARILREMADACENFDGYTKFRTIFDANGNDVGRWKLDPDEPHDKDPRGSR